MCRGLEVIVDKAGPDDFVWILLSQEDARDTPVTVGWSPQSFPTRDLAMVAGMEALAQTLNHATADER